MAGGRGGAWRGAGLGWRAGRGLARGRRDGRGDSAASARRSRSPAWQAGRRKWRGLAQRPPPRRPACSRCQRRGPSRAGSRCTRPGPSGWTGEAWPAPAAPGPLSGTRGRCPPGSRLEAEVGPGRARGGQAQLRNLRPHLPFLPPARTARAGRRGPGPPRARGARGATLVGTARGWRGARCGHRGPRGPRSLLSRSRVRGAGGGEHAPPFGAEGGSAAVAPRALPEAERPAASCVSFPPAAAPSTALCEGRKAGSLLWALAVPRPLELCAHSRRTGPSAAVRGSERCGAPRG